jgi:squalene-hopene/tetraprenyl-beta-curcumene cyclase
MKQILSSAATSAVLLLAGVLQAQGTLSKDIQQGIDKGLAFLKSQQNSDGGFWVTPEEPALSALVIAAFVDDPSRSPGAAIPAEAAKGYDFLLKNVKPDGGIYGRGRANYNTSICLTALVLRGRPEDETIIRNARKFTVGLQADSDQPGKTDNASDGGFGYDKAKPDSPAHADLSNTHFALEALYLSKKLFEDTGKPVDKKEDLNWDAAIQFVSRCQNLPKSNDQKWAGEDKSTIGAFAYTPSAGGGGGGGKGTEKDKKGGGREPMRCYGSISYAGMLSFIYAGLNADDARVKAALQWLGDNYTLEENPGMGAEGLFYYYHTMAKAMTASGLDSLKTKSGKSVDWRETLGRKLLAIQNSDGSWANKASSRWMEGDPVLVTAYTVLALEQVQRALK